MFLTFNNLGKKIFRVPRPQCSIVARHPKPGHTGVWSFQEYEQPGTLQGPECVVGGVPVHIN